MECTHCGATIDDKSNFCRYCGRKINHQQARTDENKREVEDVQITSVEDCKKSSSSLNVPPKLLDFDGKITRGEFFKKFIPGTVIQVALPFSFPDFGIFFSLVILVPLLSIGIRRLNALGYSKFFAISPCVLWSIIAFMVLSNSQYYGFFCMLFSLWLVAIVVQCVISFCTKSD